jgi:Uma2 family endonuclease
MEEGFWRGAPDLAIDVVSPSDTYTEVEEEVGDWLDAGTRMVVVVNPRTRSASVYQARDQIQNLTEDDPLDRGDVVPGWTLPLREVFV